MSNSPLGNTPLSSNSVPASGSWSNQVQKVPGVIDSSYMDNAGGATAPQNGVPATQPGNAPSLPAGAKGSFNGAY